MTIFYCMRERDRAAAAETALRLCNPPFFPRDATKVVRVVGLFYLDRKIEKRPKEKGKERREEKKEEK